MRTRSKLCEAKFGVISRYEGQCISCRCDARRAAASGFWAQTMPVRCRPRPAARSIALADEAVVQMPTMWSIRKHFGGDLGGPAERGPFLPYR